MVEPESQPPRMLVSRWGRAGAGWVLGRQPAYGHYGPELPEALNSGIFLKFREGPPYDL